MISENYRALNAQLHAGGNYGRHGDKWAKAVRAIVHEHGISSVLDYGCGQGALAAALEFPLAEYDPAVSGKDAEPAPADLVVCTDVLEHIEPELLENVLDHLQELALRYLFVAVSTRSAVKHLADGRNAHLIIWPESQWRICIEQRFIVIDWRILPDEFVALLATRH